MGEKNWTYPHFRSYAKVVVAVLLLLFTNPTNNILVIYIKTHLAPLSIPSATFRVEHLRQVEAEDLDQALNHHTPSKHNS
jgi:hypothetical protein